MKKLGLLGLSFIILVVLLFIEFKTYPVIFAKNEYSYWLLLQRKSDIEILYFGQAGDIKNSQLVNIFKVKSGVPNQKPTPLPALLGRKYWKIVKKEESFENPETSPYFLTLDVPVSEEEPFGPIPYSECGGECNWEIPGAFGLHGVGGDESRLSDDNPGSSGCIRHTDKDIAYLYNLIDLRQEIRYYIEDI